MDIGVKTRDYALHRVGRHRNTLELGITLVFGGAVSSFLQFQDLRFSSLISLFLRATLPALVDPVAFLSFTP
jgi:hypothetical protein